MSRLLVLLFIPVLSFPALADDAAAVKARAELEAAMALTPDVDNGRQIYITCAVCHRPEGWGTMDGAYPQIAGQLAAVVIKQLTDIRAHRRDSPLMLPFAVPRILGGPQHIADVAAYVAQLPMAPRNGVGPGLDLELGRQLYLDRCSDCHGAHGEGSLDKLAPAIAGQHYPYMRRQLAAIRTGQRRNANREMAQRIAAMTPREDAAVLDYVSRLRRPDHRIAVDGWLNPDFPAHVRDTMGLPPMPPAPMGAPVPVPPPEDDYPPIGGG